ncbi:MAG: HlyD family secretion protein [Candidatus Pelagadaptatus aseana]|uniref:HlyD family secretion protein n=1 Tax=Candidatus Pelagadaptatus aseana TaxID=3120508 RepID=UPI0039B2329E
MTKNQHRIRRILPFLFKHEDGEHSIHKENLRWFILLILATVVGWWGYERSHTVSISDARIASDVVEISANRSGWIDSFAVKGGQQIRAGDLLVQIDDRTAQLALQEIDLQIATRQAEIERAQSERTMVSEEQLSHLDSQKEKLNSAKAAANKAESILKLAESNFRRANTLLKKELISQRRFEEDELHYTQAKESHEQARSALSQQTSELRKAKAQLMTVELLERKIAIMEQDIERLQVKQQQLALEVEDRKIRSPIDGVIDKTFGHAQEYISPGSRLVMLHNPEKIWINANIKETQLRHIAPGMTAAIVVDAYPDRDFEATVIGIDDATTGEFALLPNPNPSGNFTKVTQRLRIKLSIDQVDGLLKPGMMVQINIDTRTAPNS